MKLLTSSTDHNETIQIALSLTGDYPSSVIFHCYWSGILNEKHFYSILSCYYFNVHKKKHKIILWVENNTQNQYNTEIEKYAEIRDFKLTDEKKNTHFLQHYNYQFSEITYYADFVRNVLLYNYGGIWFDLDCFFLRCFDPIFHHYGKEICLYQWEKQQFPNNAIYISLQPKSEKMTRNIQFIIDRNRGWGFYAANLTYNLNLDILVLPCSWFDPDWLIDPYGSGFERFFQNTSERFDFNNFCKGSFCYHWHNRWNHKIGENSIFMQLVKIIQASLCSES